VELLVVIAIIGIVAGISIPAVMRALNAARNFEMVNEVSLLADAVEKYNTAYGDYPPDGSSYPLFERHCRKVFPQILATELALFNPASRDPSVTIQVRTDSEPLDPGDERVMEPYEALVLFLGGLSDDPQRPFTGTGGPLIATGNAAVPFQYNPSRQNPMYEFNASQLTTEVINIGGNSYTISNDETRFSMPDGDLDDPQADPRDCLPGFMGAGEALPLVYFDSRTYGSIKSSGAYYFVRNTFYTGSATTPADCARPYKSDIQETAKSSTNPVQNQDLRYKYMNDKTFQIIGPGLTDTYGALGSTEVLPNGEEVPDLTDLGELPGLHSFPSGDGRLNATGMIRFNYTSIPSGSNPQLDNVTNFGKGSLNEGQ
jgi:type II secretory pathway pseudopilin PulG